MLSLFNTGIFLLSTLVLFFIFKKVLLNKQLKFIPTPLALLVIGYGLSEAWISLDFDTGIRWYSLHKLCLNTFIPIIIFATALRFKLFKIKPFLAPVITLALPLMLFSILMTAIILYYGVGHAVGFPWIAAFIAASLLSSTESGPIRELIKTHPLFKRIEVMLEAESLFKDVTAIALFMGLVTIAQMPDAITMNNLLLQLLVNIILGCIIGIIFGFIFIHTRYAVLFKHENIILSIFLSFVVFHISNSIVNVSGVMSLLAMAWVIQFSKEGEVLVTSLQVFWDKIAILAVCCIFILAGATINLDMFVEQWLAILIAISACFIARWVNIYGIFSMFSNASEKFTLQKNEKHVLLGSGIRGSVTLALALTLPIQLDYWYTVQSMAYGVVIFSLLVQLPLLQRKLSKF